MSLQVVRPVGEEGAELVGGEFVFVAVVGHVAVVQEGHLEEAGVDGVGEYFRYLLHLLSSPAFVLKNPDHLLILLVLLEKVLRNGLLFGRYAET